MERCAEDDPRRCKGLCERGQCPFKAEEGSTFCMRHGAYRDFAKANKAEIRSYNLAKWKSSIDKFAGADNVKSLREEIGIARLTLESILKLCKDEYELLVYSSKISMMLKDIRELVIACYKIEEHLGFVLDKSAVINLSEQIVNIIQVYLPPETLDQIAEQIANTIVKAGNVLEEGAA